MSKGTNLMKFGFSPVLRGSASFMILIAVAMAFFVSGFIMLRREKARQEQDQNQTTKMFAYVLMGMGIIVGLGFGSGTFFNELGNEF